MGPRVRVRASCEVGQWNPGWSWAEHTLAEHTLLWMPRVLPSLYSFLQLGILVITATMAAH